MRSENILAREKIRKYFNDVNAVVHLAANMGFPACRPVGPPVS
jgi:hypothetical protein